jgi:hypothetical protein
MTIQPNVLLFSRTIFAILHALAVLYQSRSDYFATHTALHISNFLDVRQSIKQLNTLQDDWQQLHFAISFSNIVLPVLVATIIPRCPLPIGENKSMILVEIVLCFSANLNFQRKHRVKCSNETLSRTT